MASSKGDCSISTLLRNKIYERNIFIKEQILPLLLDLSSKAKEYYFTLLDRIHTLLGQINPASLRDSIPSQRIKFEEPPMCISDISDLGLLQDTTFWIYLHMNRETVKFLLREAEAVVEKTDLACHNTDVPLHITIVLLIWYLRSDKNHLEDAVKLFNLESLEVAETALRNGLNIICKLKEFSGLEWPTENDELEYTAKCIKKKFTFESIMGVLTHKVFTSENKKRMLLQAVFNEKNICIHAEMSYNTKIAIAFRTVPSLMHLIENLPEEFCIIADEAYNACNYWNSIDRVITPMEDSHLDDEDKIAMPIFNLFHEAAMSIATNSLDEIIKRFPRLLKLPECNPEFVIAACVLHNYCVRCHDEHLFTY